MVWVRPTAQMMAALTITPDVFRPYVAITSVPSPATSTSWMSILSAVTPRNAHLPMATCGQWRRPAPSEWPHLAGPADWVRCGAADARRPGGRPQRSGARLADDSG